jgi:hypothetical protein
MGVTPYQWAFAGLELREIQARVATADTISTLGEIWKASLGELMVNHPDEIHRPGTGYRQTSYGCVLLGDPGLRLPARPYGVDELRGASLPYAIDLLGNYPNPFNPTTRIVFNVGKAGAVKLTVMNILGQVVAVLADGRYEIGQYSLDWTATAQPSGLYFAVLESAEVKHVQKMILMK